MRVLTFEGTPSRIGEAFGESCRDEIRALYRHRMDNAIGQALAYGSKRITDDHLLEIARRCLPLVERYHRDGYQELTGIARGAQMSLTEVWAMNALTDLRDVASVRDPAEWMVPPDGEGCSSFVVMGDRTADGRAYLGQTWDLSTDNMPHVCVVIRKVTGAPRTTCLTTVGCLSLIGMNEDGVALGTTNIRTTDARPGVGYLDIIHKVLTRSELADALFEIREAPRAGAHFFYLVDRQERAAAIECTARHAHTVELPSGTYAHCNHVLAPEHVALEIPGTPMASSQHRQGRMAHLLDGTGAFQLEDLKRHLADHEGGDNAICRHDVGGISSNGAVIMRPKDGRFWAVHGPPCKGEWIALEA